jgi:acetolactate synthase-1/2/3 large subunit
MKVSDYIARFLLSRGMRHVFTLPGGMISHLLDSLSRTEGMELITVHHEQGAAFAVDGIGRFTREPAVGLATVGPGAVNLLNGIASCYYDSIPAIFLTGQVQSYLQKGSRPIRQFGFQEVDFVSMAAPVAKGTWRLRAPAEVPEALEQAFVLCKEGRPGPVVLDLPFDVQAAELDREPAAPPARAASAPPPPGEVIEALLDTLNAAERPIVLAGGGVWAAHAAELLVQFLRATSLPLASSIAALDLLPAGDPLRIGMIGQYARRSANLSVVESDAVLVLGSRLDPGLTSADVVSWKRGKKIIHVDIDPGELNLRIRGTTAITSDLRPLLESLLPAAARRSWRDRSAWLARLRALDEQYPDTRELEGCEGLNPNVFVRALSAASTEAAAYVVDAGQHTWWSAQSVQLAQGQRFISGTGLGSMGFSLPAGMGIAAATRRPVVVLVGDGALQINIQELQTLVRNALPVKLVVLNNRCHGMVRQFQEEAFEGRYPTTLWGYDAPDFERVASAYGLRARSLSEPQDADAAARWLWEAPGPALLQVNLSPMTNVYPFVPFGSPITAMQSLRRT